MSGVLLPLAGTGMIRRMRMTPRTGEEPHDFIEEAAPRTGSFIVIAAVILMGIMPFAP
jgi:hypothetical protein